MKCSYNVNYFQQNIAGFYVVKISRAIRHCVTLTCSLYFLLANTLLKYDLFTLNLQSKFVIISSLKYIEVEIKIYYPKNDYYQLCITFQAEVLGAQNYVIIGSYKNES